MCVTKKLLFKLANNNAKQKLKASTQAEMRN